ncbi:invasion associated locus B family protein [Microvirga guangxiensis]|uniref:Invasion protein IalB, involved in pathogenesis n=1 Tax=Microvirga guangxiensis TaxID=549386 RepID=A0A1G5IZG8_9HYPH|nr:invasion associated locus B family protein [Microvirga guangxiensis]SCY81304.1 Invasion protein IalB, involved in pathogenesis [Microvirga guangxiensis]
MSIATRIASLGGTYGLATALALLASAPAFAQAQPKPAAPAAQPARPAAPAAGQPAQAQQPAGPTVVQVKAEPSQPEWTKVCGKDQNTNTEICYTTRDFVSDQGQPVLALAVYDVKGQQAQKVVRFVMPLGLLLQPGLRFAVDQGQATPGRFVMCLPNGCFAEAPVKDDFIASLKKGANLNVSVQNQVGREITFAVPAAGFAKSFDGPPIDPKVLEEQQKKLQEELQKKSEEMRQKMLQSQGGAAAPSAQAAPKP